MSEKKWTTGNLISVALGVFIGCQLALFQRKAPAPATQSVQITAERIELTGRVYLAVPPIALPPYPALPAFPPAPETHAHFELPADVVAAIRKAAEAPAQLSVTSNPPKVTFLVPERIELGLPEALYRELYGRDMPKPALKAVEAEPDGTRTERPAKPEEAAAYRAALGQGATGDRETTR